MNDHHELFTLYYAIMTNTEALVKSYLQDGQDPISGHFEYF
jgi:hypothetical protein